MTLTLAASAAFAAKRCDATRKALLVAIGIDVCVWLTIIGWGLWQARDLLK